MIVLYIVAVVAGVLLLMLVGLRIAALVTIDQMLKRHNQWKAAHPNATPDEEHEFWQRAARST